VKENIHERRALPLLETLCQDAKYAVRQLRKSPRFTLAVLATLALTVSLGTTVFSVLDAVFIRPLPYHRVDLIFYLPDLFAAKLYAACLLSRIFGLAPRRQVIFCACGL
jgi:hypothetical protein